MFYFHAHSFFLYSPYFQIKHIFISRCTLIAQNSLFTNFHVEEIRKCLRTQNKWIDYKFKRSWLRPGAKMKTGTHATDEGLSRVRKIDCSAPDCRVGNQKVTSSILRFLCPSTLPLGPRTQSLCIVRRSITLHAGRSSEEFTWLRSKISWDIWQISCEIGHCRCRLWRNHTVCRDMRLESAAAAALKKMATEPHETIKLLRMSSKEKLFLSFPWLTFETFHGLLWAWGGETYSCLIRRAHIADSRWGGDFFFLAEPLVQAQGRQED